MSARATEAQDLARQIADLHRKLVQIESAHTTHDPRSFRRQLLLRAWRVGYAGMSRTAAARAIAADWSLYAGERGSRQPRDDGAELIFEELLARGSRPLAWRAIADLIDRQNA